MLEKSSSDLQLIAFRKTERTEEKSGNEREGESSESVGSKGAIVDGKSKVDRIQCVFRVSMILLWYHSNLQTS